MTHARAAFLLSILALGCDPAGDLTGARVTVLGTAGLDQLVFSARAAGLEVLGPTPRPEEPTRLIEDEQSLVVLFPRLVAEDDLSLRVEGHRDDALVSVGAVVARLQAERIIDVEITLGPPPMCGDGVVDAPVEECDDGNLEPGDGCSPECTIESGWRCAHTGAGPSTCERAPDAGPLDPDAGPVASDAGPPPTDAGACECEVGQRCVDEACICDGTSCPDGCCDAGRCIAPTVEACGRAGAACENCLAAGNADRCEAGVCRCGDGPVCGSTGRRFCRDAACQPN